MKTVMRFILICVFFAFGGNFASAHTDKYTKPLIKVFRENGDLLSTHTDFSYAMKAMHNDDDVATGGGPQEYRVERPSFFFETIGHETDPPVEPDPPCESHDPNCEDDPPPPPVDPDPPCESHDPNCGEDDPVDPTPPECGHDPNCGEDPPPPPPTGGEGFLNVSWTAPIENTDNSLLTDLAGFKIYYGLAEDSLSWVINIDGALISNYRIDNLNSDTYYVSVTAFNESGIESAKSDVSSKIIN